MRAGRDFRRVNFTSPETADKRSFEQFADEFSRNMFQSDVEADADAPFRLDVTFRLLPNLCVYSGSSSPMRTLARREALDEESVGLTFVMEGEAFLKSGDAELAAKQGAVIFGSRPVELFATGVDTKLLSVRLSPNILAPMIPNLNDLCFVPLSANALPMRLLTSLLDALDAEETIETPEAQYLAAAHVHDLSALALGARGDDRAAAAERGGRAARLAAIKQDILANLADPALSVAGVAARQTISPRYVHKLFEREGGAYSAFVLAERLKRAHSMLTDPRFIARPIGAIAFDVGFGDLSYFNRCFRRRFGATPSDVRKGREESALGMARL